MAKPNLRNNWLNIDKKGYKLRTINDQQLKKALLMFVIGHKNRIALRGSR